MACDNKMSFARPEWGFNELISSNTFNASMKRKFRWYFRIPNLTGDINTALPCMRASRPKLQFREMQAEHLNETISFPSKPEWQPISVTLYDRCIGSQNPIFSWLKAQYNPSPVDQGGCSSWWPTVMPLSFKPCATLELFDGCGAIVEAWSLEHVYPQSIDWGELDMTSPDIVTVEMSLRYDRAYQTYPIPLAQLYGLDDTFCANCTDPTCTTAQASSFPPQESPEGTQGQIPNISIEPPTSPGDMGAPDLSGFTPGEQFFNSTLNADVVPYAAPGQQPIFFAPSTGAYWRKTPTQFGKTFNTWQKWNGSTWGNQTITPSLGMTANIGVQPDFILI